MSTIFDKFNLKDRVAIVTGEVGLLGVEFCRTLADAGTAVAAVDLNVGKSCRCCEIQCKKKLLEELIYV